MDNECERNRQMRGVYAFSFQNVDEFFMAIHKKSINILPGESGGEEKKRKDKQRRNERERVRERKTERELSGNELS